MNKQFKKELLKADSGVSSMRWALIELIPVVKWMLIATPVMLLLEVIFQDKASWQEASYYIASLGVFVTGLLGTKAYQKKNEEDEAI